MKALILNGEMGISNNLDQFSKKTIDLLTDKDYKVKEVKLYNREIADCLGCFKCWTKNPGQCILKDDADQVLADIINSDLLIFLSPVVFGSYSYQLKKVLDRMIPLISPFFENIDGEIHHKKRYKKYPSILGIGIMDEDNKIEEETFKKLVRNNALNFHSPAVECLIVKDKSDFKDDIIDDKINNIIAEVGVLNG